VKPGVDLAYLDQYVDIRDRRTSVLGTTENKCRAALVWFMFRTEAALQTAGSLSKDSDCEQGLPVFSEVPFRPG